MITCGMLEISGILSENLHEAVGSPHAALLNPRPWDLNQLENGSREAMRTKLQTHEKYHIHYCWVAQCIIKRCSFRVQNTANATLSSLKMKIFTSKFWHRINDPRTKSNTFQLSYRRLVLAFAIFCAIIPAKFGFIIGGKGIFTIFCKS